MKCHKTYVFSFCQVTNKELQNCKFPVKFIVSGLLRDFYALAGNFETQKTSRECIQIQHREKLKTKLRYCTLVKTVGTKRNITPKDIKMRIFLKYKGSEVMLEGFVIIDSDPNEYQNLILCQRTKSIRNRELFTIAQALVIVGNYVWFSTQRAGINWERRVNLLECKTVK
ncbi:hypothetical protein WN51_02020 [Melipona quadrifasciata]|uniref:Uncharacterized protein n=1 Tax=Melipona quadrifasciata TaxID=166423 RepID=A0A0N0U7X1_9HYME|nr:hypothetical protein WN51_02020 [Melipona quadrifasciata]